MKAGLSPLQRAGSFDHVARVVHAGAEHGTVALAVSWVATGARPEQGRVGESPELKTQEHRLQRRPSHPEPQFMSPARGAQPSAAPSPGGPARILFTPLN